MPEDPVLHPRTSTLFRRLFKAADINDFINRNEANLQVPAFHEYITQLLSEKNDKKESVIKRSCIERTYGYQLFNGTRKPSRDKTIQLAIGLGLGMEETQKLLQIAEKSLLYPRFKRDAAVIYCIDHKFSVMETQFMLYDLGVPILGDE